MRVVDMAMSTEVQEFLVRELLRHAKIHGFAFLMEEEALLETSRERFGLTRSEAIWEMTLFIQDNGGPEGDLAIIEKDGKRFFQWRFVEWPSWLPGYVKKPKWHRKPKFEDMSAFV
ncbi:MAG: hypothetical protein JSV18_05760 [Candidatus Bathyarchaeota archaeon]|nr:MAG: hypothetical protein JSV18_05760 [Candidatus Bathyarchaeota archaeon]